MGLLSSPYEGTLIEPWTPPEALEKVYNYIIYI